MDWLIGAGLIGVCLLVAARKAIKGPSGGSKPGFLADRPAKPPLQSTSGHVRTAPMQSMNSEGIVGSWAPSTRKTAKAASQAKWVLPGETVEIAGHRISGGMIYVGSNLSSKKGGTDKCLINPRLKVATSGADRGGHGMPYWPSYSDIPPASRLAFLQWLAGGRKDPGVGIGYVFLFFYGLERRLFVDGARQEARAITDEVRRLLGIYGHNNSFRGYANKLLDAAAAIDFRTDARPPLVADGKGSEMSVPVRAYLGQRLSDGHALSAEDALLWTMSLPDCRPGIVGTRCLDELSALWRIRFTERYPSGLRIDVPAPKRPLVILYKAASGTFDGAIELGTAGKKLPDVTDLHTQGAALKGLFEAWSEDLLPYARLLGRKPEARGSVEALAVLPKELVAAIDGSPVKTIVGRIEALFGGHYLIPVTVPKLAAALGMAIDPGKLASSRNQIAAVLDRLDIGFEPDKRYGTAGLTHDGRAVLFRAPGGAPVDADRPEYKSTRAMIDVTILAASADGNVASEEYKTLKEALRDAPDLSDPERLRLLAYSALMIKDGPRQQSVLNKLASLPEADRRQIAQAAIATSLSDGHASPSEVRFLEKLYKALGFEKEDLYSALHRGAVVIDEPVTVAAEERVSGARIPPPPAAEEGKATDTGGVRIDTARLERIRSETSAVSALLADIFVEDESLHPLEATADAQPEKVHTFKGLDAAHGELLAAILAAGSLGRADYEARARGLRLLPDGAIETINEWAFETFDEAVLEADDRIGIVEHLRAELEEMETAA